MNARQTHFLLVFYALGLLLLGALRWASRSLEAWQALVGVPTPAYIALTVFVSLRFIRSPMGWAGIGFSTPFRLIPHLALGAAGAAVAIGTGELLEPVWKILFGSGRDLSRFSEDSTTWIGLVTLLAFSWSVAAFGEEFAFRGILMCGLSRSFGDGRRVRFVAYFLQAVVFGLIHAYQGPAGVVGAVCNGLVFGGVVWIARGSLWPAFFAHGLSNTYGLVSLFLQANSAISVAN